MKLGIAGLIPNWDGIDLAAARRVREAGFCGASIIFQRPLEADLDKVKALKALLDEAGLEAAQANGWYEVLVHPDDRIRAEGVRGVEALCRIGKLLDAGSVYVRPGSHNPRGAWYPHPENHTAQTFERLADSLRQCARAAQQEGVILAVEGHVLSPLDTPQRMRDILDLVASPVLKVNIDPVNFIGTVMDVHHTQGILNQLFDLLGRDIAAAHLKDLALDDRLVVHITEVVPGEGTLDYNLLLTRMNELCPQGYCLIEHLPDDKVPQARAAVLGFAQKAGIQLQY
jgi:sugar phosphate isomerase/epimerase